MDENFTCVCVCSLFVIDRYIGLIAWNFHDFVLIILMGSMVQAVYGCISYNTNTPLHSTPVSILHSTLRASPD